MKAPSEMPGFFVALFNTEIQRHGEMIRRQWEVGCYPFNGTK